MKHHARPIARPSLRGMTLVETIIAVSLFIFMAAAICATLVLSFRTSKMAHLDLAAYNLAADLCGQMQLEGYATFASTRPTNKVFQGFDRSTGDATVPIHSSATYTQPPGRAAIEYNRLNFVRIDTDIIQGSNRRTLENGGATYTQGTSAYTFAVTPRYEVISETAPTSGMTVRYVRVSVEVALPNQGWSIGGPRKPTRVSAILAEGLNATSSYINF